MTDQKSDGRAISLLSVIVIVLLVLASVLGAVAIVEYYHTQACTESIGRPGKDAKTERTSMEIQYEVAIHESGHAVLSHLLIPDRPINRIWLYTERPQGSDYLGLTEPGVAAISYPAEIRDRAIVIFFLGGLAAEQVFFGKKPPDEYEDKDAAGEVMLDYCEKVGCACPAASKVGGLCLLKDVMRTERARLYVEAVGCLEANKETVVALANQLYRKPSETIPLDVALGGFNGGSWRMLGAEELKTFFAAHPLALCPQ